MNILVIGAGIFGVTSALKLSEKHNVTLVDSNSDIMQNASKNNHNRIHFGFHYPRSVETAEQSLDGYESFSVNFKESILGEFPNYYMIEKNSKIKSDDYVKFCNRLNLNIKDEKPDINMDYTNIESSFLTMEQVFDYEKLVDNLKIRLSSSNVSIILNKTIKTISDVSGYDVIVNSTYSNINVIKEIFNLPKTKLKLQSVIIPIVDINIDKIGLTIMDGGYCSLMPKGLSDNKFLLYHVEDSVIDQSEQYKSPKNWELYKSLTKIDIFDKLYQKYSIEPKINRICKSSMKYFSFLEDSKNVGYYKTVRALPINNDDARLSEIGYEIVNNQKIISILSGKVTTCWLIADKISDII
jgi:hypothetical protein